MTVASHLRGAKEPSVSIYATFVLRPPCSKGKQPLTVNIIQNCVLPHPDGPIILRRNRALIRINIPRSVYQVVTLLAVMSQLKVVKWTSVFYLNDTLSAPVYYVINERGILVSEQHTVWG